jgi:O-antigen/teichoic acid export membrane protein
MIYIVLMAAGAGVAMLKSLLLPYILETADFGLYSMFYQAVAVSLPIATLGIIESFMLKYGRINSFDGVEVQRNYWGVFTALLFITIFILAILSFSVQTLLFPENESMFFFLLAGTSAQLFFFWFVRTERARLNAVTFAVFVLLRVVMDLCFLAVFRPETVYGVMISEISSYVIVSAAMLSTRSYGSPFHLDLAGWREMVHLVRQGIPLAAMGFVGALSLYVDRLAVGQFFGQEVAGEYNFHFLAFLPALAIYNIFYQHALPRINRTFRDSLGGKEFKKITSDYAFIFVAVSISILIFGMGIFPVAANILYGIEVDIKLIAIISVSSVFYFLNSIEILLVVKNKGVVALVNNSISLAISILLTFLFYKVFEFDWIYLSIVFLISRVLIFALNTASVYLVLVRQ